MTDKLRKPAATQTGSAECCDHRAGSLDDAGRRKLLGRLRRIEGQIRGISRMVDENRYCPDVLLQMSAVSESVRAAARVLLESHLRHCVTDAVRSKDERRTEEVYAEMSNLFARFAR